VLLLSVDLHRCSCCFNQHSQVTTSHNFSQLALQQLLELSAAAARAPSCSCSSSQLQLQPPTLTAASLQLQLQLLCHTTQWTHLQVTLTDTQYMY
jgi:hypothetical protein